MSEPKIKFDFTLEIVVLLVLAFLKFIGVIECSWLMVAAPMLISWAFVIFIALLRIIF